MDVHARRRLGHGLQDRPGVALGPGDAVFLRDRPVPEGFHRLLAAPAPGGRQLYHRPGAQEGAAGAQTPHPDHQPRHLPGGEAGFQQCPGRGEPLHLYPGEAGSARGA